MATVDISLPDSLQEFVQIQVGSGRVLNASDYVLNLIREDERRKAHAALEVLLVEGLESGEATEMTATDWEDIRMEGLPLLEERRSRKMA
jgi:antitoxin ParD1/3/4